MIGWIIPKKCLDCSYRENEPYIIFSHSRGPTQNDNKLKDNSFWLVQKNEKMPKKFFYYYNKHWTELVEKEIDTIDITRSINEFDRLFHMLVDRKKLKKEDMDKTFDQLELIYHAVRDTVRYEREKDSK